MQSGGGGVEIAADDFGLPQRLRLDLGGSPGTVTIDPYTEAATLRRSAIVKLPGCIEDNVGRQFGCIFK